MQYQVCDALRRPAPNGWYIEAVKKHCCAERTRLIYSRSRDGDEKEKELETIED